MNNRYKVNYKPIDWTVLIFLALTTLVVLMALGCAPEKAPTGPKGEPGQSITGPSGPPGTSPSVTTQPALPAECPNGGTDVLVNGNISASVCDGQNGADGTNGTNGTNGINLSPVTLVQLCPGSTTYPTVFVEYGLCIANNLYGVYSANNGFLALLPPGNYTSNAIGSSCNLTILADCVVTN